MRRLTTSIDSHYGRVEAKLQAFKEHRGVFANMPLVMKANIPPHEWWYLVGEGGTHSTFLVMHILVRSVLLCHMKGIGVVILLCRTKLVTG